MEYLPSWQTCFFSAAAILLTALIWKFWCRPRVVNKWNSYYDFIIVGAGAAGCVVADRLSADGRFAVLVLEAGGDGDNNFIVDMPVAAGAVLTDPKNIWNDLTTPQKNSKYYKDQRSCAQHGKMLGGGSSVNWMLYVRGHAEDYNNWEKLGCVGWSWKSIEKYFKKIEDYFINDDRLGHGGPITISENLPRYGVSDHILKACEELGIKQNQMYNAGNSQGVFRPHMNTRRGKRCSTAKGYLRPAMKRSNVHVVTGAHVSKILFEGKKAVGVRFVKAGGFSSEVFANKEVIVSAGAINSPHLLMVSGVGPREQLHKHGIPLIADLPVGKNLQDHFMVNLSIFFEKTQESGIIDMAEFRTPTSIFNHFVFGTGPLSANPVQVISFTDVNEDGGHHISSTSPKLEILFVGSPLGADHENEIFRLFFKECNFSQQMMDQYYSNTSRCGIVVGASVQQPQSRGTVTLASADPMDRPLINPNILQHPQDRHVLKAGLRTIKKLVNTKAMQSLGAYLIDMKYTTRERLSPQMDPNSDEYLDSMIEHLTSGTYHHVGTCKMGAEGDETAVVDPTLRVQGGVEGLRVVDTSIMPQITSGNVHAPAIMIGEKASDMILQAHQHD